MKEKFLKWLRAAGVRALKTFAQAMVSMLSGEALGIMDVEWLAVLSVSAMAALISLLTSVASLPELDWTLPSSKEAPMSKCDLNTVIQVAEAEIGYLEKKSNSQLDEKTANAGKNNYTKYNRDYMLWDKEQVVEIPNGSINMQWCAAFLSWIFVMAYGLVAAATLLCGGLHCYTPTCASRFKKAGRYIKRGEGKPQPGDVVFFYSTSKGRIGHVGLVYKVTSSKVYTIEGNTSGANTLVTNGGGVRRKSYSLTSTYIDGYGRPDYDNIEASHAATSVLGKGSSGAKVTTLQESLVKRGYNLGTYGSTKNGVDGDFGSKTEEALKQFQASHGLPVTGQYGEEDEKMMTIALSGAPEQKKTPKVRITGNTVNIRTGPGKEYVPIHVAKKGETFELVVPEGWFPIKYGGHVYWVGDTYADKEE